MLYNHFYYVEGFIIAILTFVGNVDYFCDDKSINSVPIVLSNIGEYSKVINCKPVYEIKCSK